MNQFFILRQKNWVRAGLFVVIGALSLQTLKAQPFVYSNNDLVLGFRKVFVAPESPNNDVVVDIGQASTYVNAAMGAQITVPNFSLSQLVPGCYNALTDLTWSVTGWYHGTAYPGYTNNTLWLTQPRTDPNVPSAAPTRLGYSVQQTIRTEIASIFTGAAYVSQHVGVSNQYNTVSFVREDDGTYGSQDYSAYMASLLYSTNGTLQDTWPGGNLENTTPGVFTGSSRCDLYEVRPLTDAQGNIIVDPHTGTNGPAYYVGYFQFNTDGTMKFTRASAAPPLPPAPVVSITRSGGLSTISFGTTNGATYTLYYTNSAGLTQPVSIWPSLPGTIAGSGQPTNFTDTTTDPTRFYRVGAH